MVCLNNFVIENYVIKCLNSCKDILTCGLAGHRHCIVSNGSHTFHLRVFNLFIDLFDF